ncbi:Pycsar system effector family protein [Rufibacter tibetensis]|uniref:Pycsar system effector family protein n=1 Tax=Rufibacter tibetensis TaxID=512763 RepID=UPI0007845272|nr:Pycsar system effector family protein [Rufibacter tibetensis]
MKTNSTAIDILQELEAEQPVKAGKKKKEKVDKPTKGIETLFRVTSNNSQQLSNQADAKANILITVNSIIISVLLGAIIKGIESNNYLTVPSLMLLVVCLITIVFSILSTRPHVPQGTYTQREINEKKANLLFFGNFYSMPFDIYAQDMLQLMEDKDFLYLSLIKDVFSQGGVLGKKYKLLKIAYDVFMFGLIISVIAFVIAFCLQAAN